VVPPSSATAGVDGPTSQPAQGMTSHSKRLVSKHKRSNRHQLKTSKSSKQSHSRLVRLSQVDAK
jgi:hypothetical protein